MRSLGPMRAIRVFGASLCVYATATVARLRRAISGRVESRGQRNGC